MKKNKKIFVTLVILSFLALLAWKVFVPSPDGKIDANAGKESKVAIRKGEKLNYDLLWNGATAGKCSMQVVGKIDFEGQRAWKLQFEFHTEGLADTVINTHSKLESLVDEKLTRSLYHRDDRKGRKVRVKELKFDWKDNSVRRLKNGEARQRTTLTGPAFDPLALLYSFRAQPLKAGEKRLVRVTDGKKCHECAVTVADAKLNINEESYGTFLVEVDLKDLDTALTKGGEGKILIWFSKDASQRLLKVESQLYGTLSLILVGSEKVGEARTKQDK